MNEKKFERFSPRPIGPKKMSKNWFAGNVFFSSSLVVFFCCFIICVFVFYFVGVDKFKLDSQGLIFKTQKELTSKLISTASKISK